MAEKDYTQAPLLEPAETDIWSDPYPGTGPVAYDTGKPYHSATEQGFIEGSHGPDVLAEAARRREGGASLSDIRRDLGLTGDREVSDATLERAIDGAGRSILTQMAAGRGAQPRRWWGGIPKFPTKAEYEAQQAAARAAAGQK